MCRCWPAPADDSTYQQAEAAGKGGDGPARPAEAVSFWDFIKAVEGSSAFFQCAEIRKKNTFVANPSVFTDKCPPFIKVVLQEAENLLRASLRAKSLRWLHEQVCRGFPDRKKQAIAQWGKGL
ncbi:MAG: hypothetical protein HY916_11210 [Desulfovibrio sp.]|jgi:DNA-binding IscR family transcriptional regulator|nr:hypothetical protein [Desulfovibrio sp.]